MIGWILGGAAALGAAWLGYKQWKGGSGDVVTGLLNFRPFAVKQGQPYVFHVLAPTDLAPFVMKMFKDEVAAPRISPIVIHKNLVASGVHGPRNVDLYELRVIWKAPDSQFTPEGGAKKLGLQATGTSAPRALAQALYDAAGASPGTEARLRFFPVAAALDVEHPVTSGTRLAGWTRAVG